MIVFNRTREQVVALKVEKADTAWKRAKGLLGRASLDKEEGLWIEPCSMVHTFFMRFPLDLVFVDRNLRVLRVQEDLEPWWFSSWVFGSRSVLELPAGALLGSVEIGDELELR